MKKIIGVIKKLINQPRLIYYYIQKSIRVPFLRSSLAKIISILNPPAKNIELAQATQCYNELESVGFSFIKGILTPAQVQDIKNYLLPLECTEIRTSGRTTCRVSEGVPASCRKLFYDAKDLTACPHVLELANNPMLLATAEKHLGCRPTVSFITAWWSFPGVPEPGEQVYQDDMYHRDVEDYSFLKLFVYLTDVGDENGPHVFVKGTHNSKNLVRRGLITDEEVFRNFDKNEEYFFKGPQGTAFLENTWGIHRASPLVSGRRLILQIQYSLTGLNPWAPATPVANNLPQQFDPYVNRIYFKAQ